MPAEVVRLRIGKLGGAVASLLVVAIVAGLLTSCQGSSPQVSQLPPTLTTRQVSGGAVAFQNGIAVPSFSYQARPHLDLSDHWLMERAHLDETATFEPRDHALPAIAAAAAGRTSPGYNDSTWQPISALDGADAPPEPVSVGTWYRRHFSIPADWPGTIATLSFSAVNYIADVWLNGRWLGYHEGGSTPFAFDVSSGLRYRGDNVIAVRVYDPPYGSRLDVIPWGLTDFRNYAGLIGPVSLEASSSPSVARADVVPHLDAADVTIVLQNRSAVDVHGVTVHVTVLPAVVTDVNREDPNPLDLVPADATAVASTVMSGVDAPATSAQLLSTQFEFQEPALWSLTYPALYVLAITVDVKDVAVDNFADTFGLRTIRVDPNGPRLLLNRQSVVLDGAAIHNESVEPAGRDGSPHGGRWQAPADVRDVFVEAAAAGVNLIRTDHSPAEPNLLMLADRTGFAVWEEIPLYHETPETFAIAEDRGIAVQMLSEMVLRDMNRPSVLFHGFANEGLGVGDRESILSDLLHLDRKLDGTRLLGQAMYGFDPSDPTSGDLDVAAYTMYDGVFYGASAVQGTARALQVAHATYPNKPIMIMEFGRWSDNPGEDTAQAQVFTDTWTAIAPVLTSRPGGFVAAATWWSLQDYWSDRDTHPVEHFGLYRPDGTPRPVARVAARSFSGPIPQPDRPVVVSGGRGQVPQGPDFRVLGLLILFAALLPLAGVAVLVTLLARRRRRAGEP